MHGTEKKTMFLWLINNNAKYSQWCICKPGSTLSYLKKKINECAKEIFLLRQWLHKSMQLTQPFTEFGQLKTHYLNFFHVASPPFLAQHSESSFFSTCNCNFMRNSPMKVIIHSEEYFRAYLQTGQEVCTFHA